MYVDVATNGGFNGVPLVIIHFDHPFGSNPLHGNPHMEHFRTIRNYITIARYFEPSNGSHKQTKKGGAATSNQKIDIFSQSHPRFFIWVKSGNLREPRKGLAWLQTVHDKISSNIPIRASTYFEHLEVSQVMGLPTEAV